MCFKENETESKNKDRHRLFSYINPVQKALKLNFYCLSFFQAVTILIVGFLISRVVAAFISYIAHMYTFICVYVYMMKWPSIKSPFLFVIRPSDTIYHVAWTSFSFFSLYVIGPASHSLPQHPKSHDTICDKSISQTGCV